MANPETKSPENKLDNRPATEGTITRLSSFIYENTKEAFNNTQFRELGNQLFIITGPNSEVDHINTHGEIVEVATVTRTGHILEGDNFETLYRILLTPDNRLRVVQHDLTEEILPSEPDGDLSELSNPEVLQQDDEFHKKRIEQMDVLTESEVQSLLMEIGIAKEKDLAVADSDTE